MGVVAGIGAILLGSYIQGRAQQRQMEAQAKAADQNAQIAYENSKRLDAQAQENEKNAAVNEENKRRKFAALNSQNITALGKSGIEASGSAAAVLGDNVVAQENEISMERYNARQKTDSLFQESTNMLNQGDVYKDQARQYRKAGKQAMINSMLTGALTGASMAFGGGAGKWSKNDLIGVSAGSSGGLTKTVGGNVIRF